MEPIVNGLEIEYAADVAFDRINASSDRGQAAMQAYDVRGHPSYVFLDADGEVVWQFAGQIGARELRAQMALLRP